MACHNCGARESKILPVWENPSEHSAGNEPRWRGCTECRRMVRTAYLANYRDRERDPPQATLTDAEVSRVPIGNQNTPERLTLVEWQGVKGAALHYGVSDWVAESDPTLTYEENIGLMKAKATANNEQSLRSMESQAP